MQSILWAAVGTGFTFLMTATGAAMVFLFRARLNAAVQRIFLGFAAGVMLCAAVIGLILGVISLVIVMLLWNYLITPIYQKMPREAIVDLLLPVFLPFNAVKGGMNLAATLLLYKPVVTALRRAKLIPESDHAVPPVAGKKRLGVALVSLFVLATFVLLALVLAGVI